MRNVLKLRGTMLFGKYSMHIGMKVSNVKPLQYYCSCLPVSILLPMNKLLFWKKLLCSGNMVLCRLAKCCDVSIFALAAKFHLEPYDVVCSSITYIKDSFWLYFFYINLVTIMSFCIISCVLLCVFYFLFMLHSCLLNWWWCGDLLSPL